MELSEQSVTFAVTIAIGMLLGMLFDFYRIVHGRIKPRTILTSVSDLIYWIVATVIIFVGLVASNWGELRAYVFIGLFSGAIIYFRLLSRYFTAGFIYLLTILVWVVGRTVKTFNLFFLKPITWLMRLFIKPLTFTKRKTAAWCRTHLTRFNDHDEENIPPKS